MGVCLGYKHMHLEDKVKTFFLKMWFRIFQVNFYWTWPFCNCNYGWYIIQKEKKKQSTGIVEKKRFWRSWAGKCGRKEQPCWVSIVNDFCSQGTLTSALRKAMGKVWGSCSHRTEKDLRQEKFIKQRPNSCLWFGPKNLSDSWTVHVSSTFETGQLNM